MIQIADGYQIHDERNLIFLICFRKKVNPFVIETIDAVRDDLLDIQLFSLTLL